jgi:hypothetical protein
MTSLHWDLDLEKHDGTNNYKKPWVFPSKFMNPIFIYNLHPRAPSSPAEQLLDQIVQISCHHGDAKSSKFLATDHRNLERMFDYGPQHESSGVSVQCITHVERCEANGHVLWKSRPHDGNELRDIGK